jgi:hypothetical protein
MATLRQRNHSCVAGTANNGNATATQQGRLHCQCRKDNSEAMMTQQCWSYAGRRRVKTGSEEGGCKGGGAGGKGWIIVIVVVVNGKVDGNGGRRQPQTAMRFLLPGEDGGGDGS